MLLREDAVVERSRTVSGNIVEEVLGDWANSGAKKQKISPKI